MTSDLLPRLSSAEAGSRGPDRAALEPRFVCCPACGGDGEWEVPTGHYSSLDGSLATYTRRCTECNGKGEVEGVPEPRTEDELEFEP